MGLAVLLWLGWWVLVVVTLVWLFAGRASVVWIAYGSPIWVCDFGVFGLVVVWVGGWRLGLVLVNSVVNYISCCVMILFCFVVVLWLLQLDCFSAWFTFNCVWGLFAWVCCWVVYVVGWLLCFVYWLFNSVVDFVQCLICLA